VRELLLNLVRLRYLETPEFPASNVVSTQMSLERVVGLGTMLFGVGSHDRQLIVN
jgi:hypothetical protein